MKYDTEKMGPLAGLKVIDCSTVLAGPLSAMVGKEAVPDPQNVSLRLWINDELKQDGATSLMIFKIDFLIHHISSIMTLERGDIIATGTPKGVSQIHPGDTLRAAVDGVGEMVFRVRG